ncbi:MAG: Ppx/GppA phosphatase family protein [Deltaproteobacteria bacterium]
MTSARPILAAIDVGTNAVRLELARPEPDGSLALLHQERDPTRPGEGVFATGAIPREVADRLLSTLRRYSALCRRHQARVRAVATSAVREARNGPDIVRRARREAGLELEVISGREEARLICLGVLHGAPATRRAIVVDIGGGSTEVASAVGDRPESLFSVALGAVRLTELFGSSGRVGERKLGLLRSFADEAIAEALPNRLPGPRSALGSSGTIHAIVGHAASAGTAHATRRQVTRAVDELAAMGLPERRRHFDARRAEIVVAGAVILEALMRGLGLETVTAVDRGLRDGLLVDLLRRTRTQIDDHSVTDAALAFGGRFGFDLAHGGQVARLALRLFDDLAELHRLPASTRRLLEVAAILHDVGHSVSYHRHHRHSQYLIQNADLPGLTDRERDIVGRIARYHRRSTPEQRHAGLEGLTLGELQTVKKLATLVRIADSLDRSHHQPVRDLRARASTSAVEVRLRTRSPCDLELWDAEHEAALFRRVFARRLEIKVTRR